MRLVKRAGVPLGINIDPATMVVENVAPEGLVAELRERRLEALKKEGLKQGAQPWPGAGGVAEAVLLSEAFAGFAGNEVEQEEAWPDLDGAQVADVSP